MMEVMLIETVAGYKGTLLRWFERGSDGLIITYPELGGERVWPGASTMEVMIPNPLSLGHWDYWAVYL